MPATLLCGTDAPVRRRTEHGGSVTEETATEGLYFRVAGRQMVFAPGNPLRATFGMGMYRLGRLPGAAWYARYVAPRRLQLNEVAVPLPTLPPSLDGLRVGFATDIHFEPDRPTALLERGVELLN